MTSHAIEDERDFYEKYTHHLREQVKPEVLLHGIPDEEKPQIKDAIQELFAAEVINLAHEELRARGVRDELLLNARGALRLTLKNLPLPEKDHTILEAKVRQLARQTRTSPAVVAPEISTGPPSPAQFLEHRSLEPILQFSHDLQPSDVIHEDPVFNQPIEPSGHPIEPSGHDDPGKHHPHGTHQPHDTASPSCVCAWVGGMPGPSFFSSVPLPHSGGYNALYLPPGGESVLKVYVEHGVYGRDEMQVGLANETKWAKQIISWHPCSGKLASSYAEKGDGIRYMRLENRGCYAPYTIVFRKPKFLGLWVDVAHWDPKQFWHYLGGKRTTFVWAVEKGG
jgi:hypothetical protein